MKNEIELLAIELKKMYSDTISDTFFKDMYVRLKKATENLSLIYIITTILRSQKIVEKSGHGKHSTWKWISTTEPNLIMAEKILVTAKKMQCDKAKKYYKKSKTEKDTDEVKEKNIIPPDINDIIYYIEKLGYKTDPQKFFWYYQSKNWMIGKNRMTDWHAAVRTWERNRTAWKDDQEGSNTNDNNSAYLKEIESLKRQNEKLQHELNLCKKKSFWFRIRKKLSRWISPKLF